MGDVQVQEMPEDATDKIYWIATQDMLVDSMTKAMRDDLRRALDTGRWTLHVAPNEGPAVHTCKVIGV